MLELLLSNKAASLPVVTNYALFAGGNNNGLTTLKYDYTADTVSAGANLAVGTALTYSSGCSNATAGLFAAPVTITVQGSRYVWGTDSVAAYTMLTVARSRIGAASIAATAVFMGGNESGNLPSGIRDRYTHASNSVVSTTSLSSKRYNAAAVASDTKAVVGAGFDNSAFLSSTEEYTFSNNSSNGGTALGKAGYLAAALCNKTLGIFAGGELGSAYANIDEYTFSSRAVYSGAVLPLARSTAAGASNSTFGIIGGGTDAGANNLTTTVKYTFAGRSSVAGTVLPQTRFGPSAASSVPGNQ